jgi:uncharacterized protein (DUF952 family)
MTDKLIYKIEASDVWAKAQQVGAYTGSPLDINDGFIHLSGPHQVRETAAKWFAGRTGLVLIGVNTDALGAALKWETSRGGALFPHLYADLPMAAIESVTDMPLNDTGLHIFDATIP